MNKNNIVKQIIDPRKAPVVTDEQKARLGALASLTDDQIDYSDIPSRPDALWVKAVTFPQKKKQITLRLDGDVLDFFRKTGSGYQSRINAVLRTYVDARKTPVG